MKIKITILSENDIPASALNGIGEEQIKSAWQSLLDLISVMPTENNDKATVLSAEFVEEEGEAVLPSAHSEIEERTEEFAQNAPKEDLISRKAAIEAMGKAQWQKERLMELPSAQPEPQWISVTERLPESKPEDLEYPTVIACCEDGEVMTACYYESTKEWGIGENYDRIINPVAWMPLPKPYRAERRTDDANDIT